MSRGSSAASGGFIKTSPNITSPLVDAARTSSCGSNAQDELTNHISRASFAQKEHATSQGTKLCERGPYNSVPVNNYLSGDGKSYVYKGAGYYVPSERRWIDYHEYRSIPGQTRRDAILFESEDAWRSYQRNRDRPTNPGGISFTGIPINRSTTPLSAMLPFQRNAWNKPWSGSGFFVAPSNKWLREPTGPGLPSDSYLFYNEEDWIKFRYQVENPSMKTS